MIKDFERFDETFVALIITKLIGQMELIASGGTFKEISKSSFSMLKIPHPPIHIQKEIVEEIKSYQKIIDGAKQIVENYKPKIKVDEDWEMVELSKICMINPPKKELKIQSKDLEVSFVPMSCIQEKQINFETEQTKKLGEVIKGYTYFKENDVLLAKITPCFENGKSGIAKNLINNIGFGSTEFIVLRHKKEVIPEWVYYFISNDIFINTGKNHMTGSAGQKRLSKEFVMGYKIPLPSIETQKQIIAQIEEEQKLIESNKKLIEIFEEKIKAKIANLW